MTAPWKRPAQPAPEASPLTPLEPAQSPEQMAEDSKRKAKERNLRWRTKNPDKVREWQRKQYLKNREMRIAAARANEQARAARDPGAAIARRVLSREKDLTAARQREKEYRQRNGDRYRELARARTKRYRAVHAEKLQAKQRETNRAKYATDRDEINAKRRAVYAVRKAAERRLATADDIA